MSMHFCFTNAKNTTLQNLQYDQDSGKLLYNSGATKIQKFLSLVVHQKNRRSMRLLLSVESYWTAKAHLLCATPRSIPT